MKKLLEQVTSYSVEYLSSLKERRVGPSEEDLKLLEKLDFPLRDESTDPEEIIKLLNKVGSNATVGISGGRFFGFVIGGSLPVTVAASWLNTVWDQNAGLFAGSPIGTVLEEVSLKWLLDIFNLPIESAGAFVTGATMANFTSLSAARNYLLQKQGWDVESNGLFNAPPINVIVGEEAHPTLFRGLGLLGLGRKRVITVPADNQGRMRLDKLPKIDRPTILCTQAGNVNTGSFDPIKDICESVKRDDVWVHVDGAFGLWAAATKSKKYLTEGIELADSWATDAHKWLNVPYDSGLAFVKHSESLRSALYLTAPYLPQGEHREPSQFVPELSRRSRGIEIWTALYFLGRKGLSEMIERTCQHAKRFAEGLSKAGYQILNDVVINQVLVSFGDAETTNKIISEIQKDGTCWCGGTVWQGKTAMRISISSWATTEEDVERSLEAMLRIAKTVSH
jgi:glutamate/tyrosine decarboxylase-like PLP-dependent enzyme